MTLRGRTSSGDRGIQSTERGGVFVTRRRRGPPSSVRDEAEAKDWPAAELRRAQRTAGRR